MNPNFLDKLVDKSLTKEQLFEKVKHDFDLLPIVVHGMTSSKAAIRYGCGKVLMNLSEEYPEKMYTHMDFFIEMLDSKYRIITWQAMFIIANLTKVDKKKKFDEIFDKYCGFLHDEYMVTVANTVVNLGKIAKTKPYLIQKITKQLLDLENLKTTPHLTVECKRVIAEHTIDSFDMFFDKISDKKEVIYFVKKHTNSTRNALKKKANEFLKKWDKSSG